MVLELRTYYNSRWCHQEISEKQPLPRPKFINNTELERTLTQLNKVICLQQPVWVLNWEKIACCGVLFYQCIGNSKETTAHRFCILMILHLKCFFLLPLLGGPYIGCLHQLKKSGTTSLSTKLTIFISYHSFFFNQQRINKIKWDTSHVSQPLYKTQTSFLAPYQLSIQHCTTNQDNIITKDIGILKSFMKL